MLHKLIENHDGEMLGVGHDCLVQHLIRTTHRDIFAAMPVQFSKGIELALGKIFASSLEFALLLHRQAALFKMMWWPPVNTDGTNRPLNPKFEEDFNNGEEEDLKTRAMEMPLFPAVIKMGNEQGEKVRPSSTCVPSMGSSANESGPRWLCILSSRRPESWSAKRHACQPIARRGIRYRLPTW